MTALPNGHIVKIGIVTHNAAETAKHFAELFPVREPQPSEAPDQPPHTVEPSWHYKGERLSQPVELTVAHLHTDNFWFELIQPPIHPSNPWRDHLDSHGQSVMWVSINVDDGFESHSDAISQLGYETVWVEEKGFERYAYFDTVAALGLMVEVKERQAR